MTDKSHSNGIPPRQAAPDDDTIRDAVTWSDNTTYSLSLPEVYGRFVEAGLDRSLRTLQRYCEQGHLSAAKYPTETGAVWYVDPGSVDTKIEEIRQVQQTLHRPAAPRHDTPPPTEDAMSRPDADRRSMSSTDHDDDSSDTLTATDDDDPRRPNSDAARRASNSPADKPDTRDRQSATADDERYVTVPVEVLDALTHQLAAKDEQLKRQDAQMQRLEQAHDEDRRLLGAAMSIILRDDFPMGVGEGHTDAERDEPTPAQEIKPEFGRGGGNPQPPDYGAGV